MLNWTHLRCGHQDSPFHLNTPQCFHNCDVLIAKIEQVINILVLMYKTWFLVVCQWSRHLARPKLHPSKTAWSLRSSWAPSISQHHPGWIKSWNTNHTKDEKSTLREGMQCSWLLGSDFDLYTQATNPEECRRNEHTCSNMRTRGHLTRLVNLTPLNSKHPGYTWPTQVNVQDPNLAKGLEANIFFWTLLVSIWHLVTSLLMGKGQLDSYSWLPHPSLS